MPINKLTALMIKQAKTPEKEKNIADGNGLYLRLLPNGQKTFILNFVYKKIRHKITLGDAKLMSLEQARKEASHKIALIKGLKNGIGALKLNFKQCFEEYLQMRTNWSKRYKDRAMSYHNEYFKLFWYLGIAEISRADIISALEPLIKRGNRESFKKAKSYLSGFFTWALHKELCEHNPTNDISIVFLFGKYQPRHHPYLKELEQAIELKKRICNYFGNYNVRLCALLQLYTATRPSEARKALWSEFDLEKGIWTIPATRMLKTKKEHEIILSKQILKALKEHKANATNDIIFYSVRSKNQFLSENTLNLMLKNLGYDTQNILDMHGFRGTFATIANDYRDEHGCADDIIQSCLSHTTKSEVTKAYNHSEYKKYRARVLQWWGDKLGDI